ncbi:PREDICTED: probable serine/threonine-protein kinase ndrD isoform X2 [Polistes dominula]|uniref:Probable serine/threonine-protein kinase ndrD isoform X2 n=1 Tax=Polistes dominula TaxID=743375 RepID=A0ABM1IU12_POLDO|nr:PREDICTED: probable serine/threonine-protein kinase ndrD isoform X2 [Polistes dominula]
MEYQNKTLQNTSKKQQVAVISKLQNMQWLKNNVPLSGYVKKGVKNLKDLEVVKSTHTSVNNNVDLPNFINTNFITHDNKCNFEIETDITEKSVLLTNTVSTWNLQNKRENTSSLLNKPELDLKQLEEKEIINMTNTDSLIIQNFKMKCKLEDQEKDNSSMLSIATEDTSQDAVVSNLVPLKVQDNISKTNQTNIDDKNNNDKLSSVKKLNSKSGTAMTMALKKESPSRCASKNVKENEQNKTISNNVNKQFKVNRMNSSYRKTENKSIPKTYNDSSETTQYSVAKEKKYSNSFQPIQLRTTAQSFNLNEEYCALNNKLITSDNKSDNAKPHVTIETEQVAKTPTLKDECINEFIDDKLVTNSVKQETNISSKEIEKTDENTIQDFSYNNFVNECIEQKEICINSPLQDLPNLQTNNQNIKESAYNDSCDSNPQFDNMYSSNVWHNYKNGQQNIYQQQTSSHHNFIHPITDPLGRSCPINNTLSSLIPNVPNSDVNAVHLNQYGNVPTMQNNLMNTSSISNQNLPTNTKNANMMQYQMPNMVPYNNSNVVRPQPNYGTHPMIIADEQYNLHGYGMNPLYCINNCPVCRNNYLLFHHWNSPNIYPAPVTIVTNPNQCNCMLCCNQLQSNNIIYKTPGAVTQSPPYVRTEVSCEQNVRRNFMKPISKSWYNDTSLKNNEAYNSNLKAQEVIINMPEQIDQEQKNQDNELLDKEINNLPIISPKDYMNYGSSFLANNKVTGPQTKFNEIRESPQSYNSQNKKGNRRSFLSKEYVSNANTDCGKKIFKQQYNSSYKTQ